MAKHQARPFKDFKDDDHFCNVAVAVCTGTCVAIKLSLGTLYTHTCSCSVVDQKIRTHTLKSDKSDISTQSHVPRQHPGSSKKIIISIECVHSIT